MDKGMPAQIFRCGDVLGEGPIWDPDRQRLFWTDIQSRCLRSLDPESLAIETIGAPERIGAFALTVGGDEVMAAFETGFGLFNLSTGSVSWLVRPEEGLTGRRFNDGRVDRQGRFWAGAMVEDHAVAPRRSASLWRLDRDGSASVQRTGLSISNGLCFSPDGSVLYFADSPDRLILAFDLDPDTGAISGERVFAEVEEGSPDGATVDAEGCVWSACWGAGQIVRYAPDGRAIEVLGVPTSQPTCPAFGGPELKTLFVTSARDGLTDAELSGDPHAGDIFVFERGTPGLSEVRYGAVSAIAIPAGDR
jgi:sugar lactone lactonase YvrE